METGLRVLEKYKPIPRYDTIAKIAGYDMPQNNMKQPEKGFSILERMAQGLQNNHKEHSGDYAMVLEAMGGICLGQRKISEGTSYLRQLLALFEKVLKSKKAVSRLFHEEAERRAVRKMVLKINREEWFGNKLRKNQNCEKR